MAFHKPSLKSEESTIIFQANNADNMCFHRKLQEEIKKIMAEKESCKSLMLDTSVLESF